jgi:uncharacterized protein (TIGR02391 family)
MPREFRLTDDDILALPVDELALEVLRDVVANPQWNSANWMLLAAHGYSQVALRALAEAWAWLHSNGLVAEDLEKQTTLHAVFVTRLGTRVASEGMKSVRAISRLSMDLHPEIGKRARPQYLLGKFELAAFDAMKVVEVRVRSLVGASQSLIGVKLMRNAFGADGRLVDPNLDPGEQVARMELFAGAIGLFKNHTSHRDVEYDDPVEAAEVILLADLLMRLLDRIEREQRDTP